MVKTVRMGEETHQRLTDARLVDGETYENVINRALDALEESDDS